MQAAKFLEPDGMDPGLLKEITDNHREHNKHRQSFKRAGQRLTRTQKWQNTKQGNRSTICSSPTSVFCRTMEATNPAWIKLQSNASHVQPWDGDSVPAQHRLSPTTPASSQCSEFISKHAQQSRNISYRGRRKETFKPLLRPTDDVCLKV